MQRFDRETSVWVMEEELKHYTHIVLINTGVGHLEKPRERAIENARFFKKQYEEIQGNLDYFRKLVEGPYTDHDFFPSLLGRHPGDVSGKRLKRVFFLSLPNERFCFDSDSIPQPHAKAKT